MILPSWIVQTPASIRASGKPLLLPRLRGVAIEITASPASLVSSYSYSSLPHASRHWRKKRPSPSCPGRPHRPRARPASEWRPIRPQGHRAQELRRRHGGPPPRIPAAQPRRSPATSPGEYLAPRGSGKTSRWTGLTGRKPDIARLPLSRDTSSDRRPERAFAACSDGADGAWSGSLLLPQEGPRIARRIKGPDTGRGSRLLDADPFPIGRRQRAQPSTTLRFRT